MARIAVQASIKHTMQMKRIGLLASIIYSFVGLAGPTTRLGESACASDKPRACACCLLPLRIQKGDRMMSLTALEVPLDQDAG